jgi:hypothetical protein
MGAVSTMIGYCNAIQGGIDLIKGSDTTLQQYATYVQEVSYYLAATGPMHVRHMPIIRK